MLSRVMAIMAITVLVQAAYTLLEAFQYDAAKYIGALLIVCYAGTVASVVWALWKSRRLF